jgi:hypothetical protein
MSQGFHTRRHLRIVRPDTEDRDPLAPAAGVLFSIIGGLALWIAALLIAYLIWSAV